MSTVGITIPVHNRKEFTIAILQQLAEQIDQLVGLQTLEADAVQIIVVDDGSSDGTAEIITARFPQVHLLIGTGDLWWTGAIGEGMTYAAEVLKTDYIVWLNDDIQLVDNFIDEMMLFCRDPEEKVLTGGIICDRLYPDWIVFGGVIASQSIHHMNRFMDPLLKVDTLNGNIAILPTRIITDIGLPDVTRFRHYGGDFEYVCRAKKNGYVVHLSRDLRATTDYSAADVIRYMPLWIQWAVSDRLLDKWRVLMTLTNRRSPHNVEHMVNSIYRAQASVPRWRYVVFYCRKLVKIMGSGLVPWSMRKQRIQAYFESHNVPLEVAQAVLNNV
jgi:GT2 family glycosyltransferase